MTRPASSSIVERHQARRLTVGYVLPWTVVGGGELATLRLALAMAGGSAAGGATASVDPVAYCASGNAAVRRLFEEASIPTRTYVPGEFSYRHPLPFITASVRLARQFRRDGLDLVHCADLMGVYHAGAAATLAQVPLVCHIRSQFPDALTRRRKVPICAVDHFAFVSRATWQHFDRLWPVAEARGSVIYDWPPPVASGSAGAAPAQTRASLGVPGRARLITMVARLAPPKDFDTLLAAMSSLSTSHPDAHLLLVGSAPDTSAGRHTTAHLQARVAAAPLAGRVTWAGFRSDVPSILAASDVVALVSTGEGMPLVLLEAMAHARPVVATDVGGIAELVVHGATGLLHRQGDVRGLAGHLTRLLDHPDWAASLGASGRERVTGEFTAARAVAAVRAVYDRLTRRRAAVAAS